MMTFFVTLLVLMTTYVFGSRVQSENTTTTRRLRDFHKYIDPPPLKKVKLYNLDLVIVYNGYIYPQRDRWLNLMQEQLDEFNCNGMADRAKHFYISLSMSHANESSVPAAKLLNETIAALSKIIPKAIFDVTLENRFEYPGIRTLWDVANALSAEAAQKTILVYMHSKGMVNAAAVRHYGSRLPLEVTVFHATFDRWDGVMEKFHKDPSVNKVGCFPDQAGHIWINLFYTRASYVQKLVNPTISSNRWYYEQWLGKLNSAALWPVRGNVRHVEFPDHNSEHSTPSGCSDCWSTCASTEALGVVYDPKTLYHQEFNKMSDYEWLKCREETALPFIDYFK